MTGVNLIISCMIIGILFTILLKDIIIQVSEYDKKYINEIQFISLYFIIVSILYIISCIIVQLLDYRVLWI